MARKSDALVFLRACSFQATAILETVSGEVKASNKPFQLVGSADEDASPPVPGELQPEGIRFSVDGVSISGVGDPNLVALCKQTE